MKAGVWAAGVGVLVVAGLAGYRLTRPAPAPAVSWRLGATVPVRAGSPAWPWPQGAEAALAVGGGGMVGVHGPQDPVPVGSITKLMTAPPGWC